VSDWDGVEVAPLVMVVAGMTLAELRNDR